MHLVDFEWHLTGPDQSLEAIRIRPDASPATCGHADEKRAIGAEGQPYDAALQAASEIERGALPMAADLLEEDAHHHGVVLVADEDLPVEGAEPAAGSIPFEAGRRLPHLDVGKPDGRHLIARYLLVQVLHPGASAR